MAIYDGITEKSYALFDQPSMAETPIDFDMVSSPYSFEGVHTYVDPALPSNVHAGFVDRNATPAQQVLERIYFFPIDDNLEHRYDLGLISSEVEVGFQIWNAFTRPLQTVSLITSSSPDGTILNVPATPWNLTQNYIHDYSATITEAGPPTQNTSYFFTIAGFLFELELTAERLIELDRVFLPNWDKPTEFSFELETVLAQTKTTKEQRRSLFETTKRVQVAFFTVWDSDYENAHNLLKTAHEKVFFIPIYHEVLMAENEILNGLTILDIVEDLNDFWNLRQRTSFIQIQSIDDSTLTEVLSLSSIDLIDNQLIFSSPITKNFIRKKTIIMPIMKAKITDFKPTYRTDKIAEFVLNFEELRGL